jgi:tetratricopeptide (TPR) repeat protein
LERGYATAAYHSSVTGDLAAGLAAYRTLLQQYPGDHRALNNSGVLYFALGDYEQAYDYWSAGVAADSTWPIGFTNVAFISTMLGRDDVAHATMQAMEAKFGDNPRVTEGRGDIAFMLRDFERADRHYRQVLVGQSGNPRWQSDINDKLASSAAVRGKMGEANRYWQASRSALQQRGLPANVLQESLQWAYTHLMTTGDAVAATRLAESALQATAIDELPVADRPYEAAVRYFTAVGDVDRARTYLNQMDQSQQRDLGLDYGRQYSRSRGLVQIGSGDMRAGMQQYRQGIDGWFCRPCATAELARLHDTAGDADSARAYWEEYANTRVFPIGIDATYLAASYRRLGELYEETGDRAKAVEYYNRFVELWDEADAELQPLVRDTRGRIVRLVGEEG